MKMFFSYCLITDSEMFKIFKPLNSDWHSIELLLKTETWSDVEELLLNTEMIQQITLFISRSCFKLIFTFIFIRCTIITCRSNSFLQFNIWNEVCLINSNILIISNIEHFVHDWMFKFSRRDENKRMCFYTWCEYK